MEPVLKFLPFKWLFFDTMSGTDKFSFGARRAFQCTIWPGQARPGAALMPAALVKAAARISCFSGCTRICGL